MMPHGVISPARSLYGGHMMDGDPNAAHKPELFRCQEAL
jgi:hypothetical protein